MLNARMADGTARCADCCDGQPQGYTNDLCLYCGKPDQEMAHTEAFEPEEKPVIGALTISPSAVGVLVIDEMGTCHGIACTERGAKVIRRRLLKRFESNTPYDHRPMDEAWSKHFHAWN